MVFSDGNFQVILPKVQAIAGPKGIFVVPLTKTSKTKKLPYGSKFRILLEQGVKDGSGEAYCGLFSG